MTKWMAERKVDVGRLERFAESLTSELEPIAISMKKLAPAYGGGPTVLYRRVADEQRGRQSPEAH